MADGEEQRQWAGARWWKVDFHTHTPASTDYWNLEATPREWLQACMDAGLEAVVVTDHNGGGWIDRLKAEAAQMVRGAPDGFRPPTVFPGVELSVSGGIHLLAILPEERGGDDISRLLGAVEYRGEQGSRDTLTTKSFEEVVKQIAATGGIAVPAHVDQEKGLFKARQGLALKTALELEHIFAMEQRDGSASVPQLYRDLKICWTRVLGSDAHALDHFGRGFTWVKMESPTLEGLRLALIDGEISVRPGDEFPEDPNAHADVWIEELEVDQARYMGRRAPLKMSFNPWLNAIIGGRGTGKSTLVEFMRAVLRREGELQASAMALLANDLRKYTTTSRNRQDDGLVRDETVLRLVYRKNGTRFRLSWSPRGHGPSVEEETEGGRWQASESDIQSRFKVQLFSQKQIYQMAKEPGSLLRIVDEIPAVDHAAWRRKWSEAESRYTSLQQQMRELEAKQQNRTRLVGELDDIRKRLKAFEGSGHADILKAYQRGRRQQRMVESWEETWSHVGSRLRAVAESVVPDPLDLRVSEEGNPEEAALIEASEQLRKDLESVRDGIVALAATADDLERQWEKKRQASLWSESIQNALDAYKELQANLEMEGVTDPGAYGTLLQQRQALEAQLQTLDEDQHHLVEVRRQAEERVERLEALREELANRRQAALNAALTDNPHVRIQLRAFGDRDEVEADLRRILGCEAPRFGRDIGSEDDAEGLLPMLDGDTEPLVGIRRLKQRIRDIVKESVDPLDSRFGRFLRAVPPAALDRIETWFPEDTLDVEYSATGDGRNFRSLQRGSPGQKTAALLAFLMAQGDVPLILDQPEDDLDNKLISDLVVAQLRASKSRRQVIVVTHNPNIVVNGDAELVHGLAVGAGQTQVECSGSLQVADVRAHVCKVMEGGEDALRQRYLRIGRGGAS